MCLKSIEEKFRKNDRSEIWYKVVKKARNQNPTDKQIYMGMYRTGYSLLGERYINAPSRTMITVGGKNVYPKKKVGWFGGVMKEVNDYSKKPKHVGGFKYKAGFHFYTLKAVKNMLDKMHSMGGRVILECAVTDIRIKGTDRYGEACVGQEYTPIREIKYTSKHHKVK